MTTHPIISTIKVIHSKTQVTWYTKDLPSLPFGFTYLLFQDNRAFFIDDGTHVLVPTDFTADATIWQINDNLRSAALLEVNGPVALTKGLPEDTESDWQFGKRRVLEWEPIHWRVNMEYPDGISLSVNLEQPDGRDGLVALTIKRGGGLGVNIHATALPKNSDVQGHDVSGIIAGYSELKEIADSYFKLFDPTFDIHQYELFK